MRRISARNDIINRVVQDHVPLRVPGTVVGLTNGVLQAIVDGNETIISYAGVEDLTPGMSAWFTRDPENPFLSYAYHSPRIESGTISHSPTKVRVGVALESVKPHLDSYQALAEKGVADGYAPLDSGVLVPLSYLRIFGPSGVDHSAGQVPDPGDVAGASKYLREDGAWAEPPGTGGGGTGGVKSLLNYQSSTDLHNGTAMTGGTYLDVLSQSITVDDASAHILVLVSGGWQLGSSAVGHMRVTVNAVASNPLTMASGTIVPLGGSHDAGAFAVGTYTVKVQARSSINNTLYVRASQLEFLNVQVLQCSPP